MKCHQYGGCDTPATEVFVGPCCPDHPKTERTPLCPEHLAGEIAAMQQIERELPWWRPVWGVTDE